MSAFRVGQRVRVVGCAMHPEIAGKEAVIVRKGHCDPEHWALDVDGIGMYGVAAVGRCRLAAYTSELAPLTPPAADEWAADKVKQLTKPTYIEPSIFDREKA